MGNATAGRTDATTVVADTTAELPPMTDGQGDIPGEPGTKPPVAGLARWQWAVIGGVAAVVAVLVFTLVQMRSSEASPGGGDPAGDLEATSLDPAAAGNNASSGRVPLPIDDSPPTTVPAPVEVRTTSPPEASTTSEAPPETTAPAAPVESPPPPPPPPPPPTTIPAAPPTTVAVAPSPAAPAPAPADDEGGDGGERARERARQEQERARERADDEREQDGRDRGRDEGRGGRGRDDDRGGGRDDD